MSEAHVHLVPHTHWDREWWMPFEGFLDLLVQMMDGLIELLSDGGFAHFHLDGQTAMIDDYLAVRPEREPDIRRLAADGKISVGPWFTQIDEFLVSGESHIRNLEWGMARVLEYGAGAPVGYLPDQFGHIGQMPQILRGAGIDVAVVWRGVPGSIDRTAFWWESPDGSRVLAEYLAFGYSVGWRINHVADPEGLARELKAAVDLLSPLSPRDRLLITVGGDHQVAQARLPPLLSEVQAASGIRAEIGSIADYVEGPPPDGITSWRGELRSAARAHLLPGVYSNRIHQKRERGRIEAMVERYAEPLAALVPGFEWPTEELDGVWRLLLWNGAHDSVCGSGVDEVARAVDARHAEARRLAEGIVERAMRSLATSVASAGVVRFNPSPFEREGVPGLGWRVDAAPPLSPERPVDVRIDDEGVHIDGVAVRLVDEPDVGDLYNFCPVEGGAPRAPERMEVRDGTLRASFPGVEVQLRAARRPGERCIRLHVTVSNERPDHRLRLHVRLADPAAGSVAVSPFELVERPVVSEGSLLEASSPTWPAKGAVLSDRTAVFGEGVLEYEVFEGRELAVTLLRCVGTISRPNLATRPSPAGPDIPTPDAQMPGTHEFDLAVLTGASEADLLVEWERFALPLLTALSDSGGSLPDRGVLLDVSGAELSAVRRLPTGEREVRVWNPTLQTRRATVGGRDLDLPPARIETVRIGPSPLSPGRP